MMSPVHGSGAVAPANRSVAPGCAMPADPAHPPRGPDDRAPYPPIGRPSAPGVGGDPGRITHRKDEWHQGPSEDDEQGELIGVVEVLAVQPVAEIASPVVIGRGEKDGPAQRRLEGRLESGGRGVGLDNVVRTVDLFIADDLCCHVFIADLLELDGRDVLLFVFGEGDAKDEDMGLTLDLLDDAHVVDLVIAVEIQVVDLAVGVVDRLFEGLEALRRAERIEGPREIEVVSRPLLLIVLLIVLGSDVGGNREQQEAHQQ
jgi:hypothetical protein